MAGVQRVPGSQGARGTCCLWGMVLRGVCSHPSPLSKFPQESAGSCECGSLKLYQSLWEAPDERCPQSRQESEDPVCAVLGTRLAASGE